MKEFYELYPKEKKSSKTPYKYLKKNSHKLK